MRAFADTNVLIYAFGDGPKAEIAKRLLDEGGVLSVQSLNEFANVARRKLKFDWDAVDIALTALTIKFGKIESLDMQTHRQGMHLARRYLLSIFDAMIVAAALRAGCDTLYSEDMHNGLVIEDRLRIVNPFA